MNRELKNITMVTYDSVVASYSSRLIYIQNGIIIHEFEINKFEKKRLFK